MKMTNNTNRQQLTMIRQSKQKICQFERQSMIGQLLALVVIMSSMLNCVQSISISGTSSPMGGQQGNNRQQQVYGLIHYPDEQQLIKKFMPDLNAHSDRSLERALFNMLLAQRLYINDDPTGSATGSNNNGLQQAMLQTDSRGLPMNVQGYEPMGPNQISGYDPGKRSYWKQCAVNAVSCFGRRKRR